jgi:Amt family ammonium transporter
MVMLMVPGLALFYGGMVRQKNVLATVMQCFMILALVSLQWAIVGYSLAFGGDVAGLIGDLKYVFLGDILATDPAPLAPTVPHLAFVFFQMMFAAITPALIIGAFAERIRFKALLLYIVLWTTFVYVPIAHWNWGDGGLLRSLGVIDFAGGLVVHTSAGLSAVAAALVIGRRQGLDRVDGRPNNVPYVILGGSLLWFGWFGFNAGSALAANALAVNALVVTNLAAAAGTVGWMLTDWVRKGKPSAVGMAVGAVCGLVAITPASGYVGPMASMIIGLVAGVLCNQVASWRARTTLDDSLDVFAAHGVGGLWGTLATGLFASSLINPAGPNGLVFGNAGQLGLQALACLVVAPFAFVGSYAILRIINLFTPVRVSPAEEDAGLDISGFGEEAYAPDRSEPRSTEPASDE